MSTIEKKPPVSGALGRRLTSPTSPPSARPATRSPTPNGTTTPNGGVARTRSMRGSIVNRRSFAGSSGLSMSSSEEEARAESIAVLEDLREKLRKSETRADQFQKETEVLQSRLEESLAEQAKFEDRHHEDTERIETLENAKGAHERQMREMERIYEGERAAMNKEKEEMSSREEEMQSIIRRLKDSLSHKSIGDDGELSRPDSRSFRHSNNSSPNIEDNQFAPPSSVSRSDSRNNSKLLLQKDRVIESLRLELAEAQIKIVESENMGGGRLQEVERLLLEARMNNARLMEDNESFQLLLQEKTLAGDFGKSDFGYMSSPARNDALDALEGRTPAHTSSSLADELSGATGDEDEAFRRLEAELKASKEQNKALTLYINKIIERLLEHQDFEAILDQSSDFKPSNASTTSHKDKDLPPPPPPKDSGIMGPPSTVSTASSAASSILQRAKSVVGASAVRATKARPVSQMPAAHSALTDPETAPSIPFGLNRAASVQRKARPQSEHISTGAFSVVNAMYKGNPASPPITGPQTPRNSTSFFAPRQSGENPNAAARAPSGAFAGQTIGAFAGTRTSVISDAGSSHSSTETSATSHTGEVSTPPPNGQSPPRQLERQATFAGNKPRPLRLVQDQASASAEEKSARERAEKRGTWYGWAMNKVIAKEGEETGKE